MDTLETVRADSYSDDGLDVTDHYRLSPHDADRARHAWRRNVARLVIQAEAERLERVWKLEARR